MRIWSLIISLLLSNSILAKDLPNSINITYDLSFEKKPLGSIDVRYRKDKSRYKIIASSNFLGAMNLLGNYQLISSGHIKGNHYFPDSIVRKNLKKDKLTTRDSRVVERKKYGHRKARRSFQFSKR